MSGFRRHLMAKIAQQEYIDGFCVQPNAAISLQINGLTYTATADNDGYWKLDVRGIDIVSLKNFAASNSSITNINFRCNTRNVSNIFNAFKDCSNLSQINGLKITNNVTNCEYAFGKSSPSVITQLTSIENLSNFDFSNCENMRATFYNYGGDIDMTLWNVEKASTFYSCYSRIAGNISGTANHKFYSATNLYGMFLNLNQASLRLDNMECPNATTYQRMFEEVKCTEIYAPKLDINSSANTTDILKNANYLTDLTLGDIYESLSLAQSPLTLQSAIGILTNLQQVTNETLTFSATTSALIQADTTAMNLVAQAQSYGWTITFN